MRTCAQLGAHRRQGPSRRTHRVNVSGALGKLFDGKQPATFHPTVLIENAPSPPRLGRRSSGSGPGLVTGSGSRFALESARGLIELILAVLPGLLSLPVVQLPCQSETQSANGIRTSAEFNPRFQRDKCTTSARRLGASVQQSSEVVRGSNRYMETDRSNPHKADVSI